MADVTLRQQVNSEIEKHLTNKRVSFGNGSGGKVAEQTFVYEKDTSTYLNNGSTPKQTTLQRVVIRNESDPPPPPSKVLVRGEWNAAPELIHPPANLEGYPLTVMSDGEPLPPVHATTSGANGKTQQSHVVFSSPLPSFQQNMEKNQHENPFRPEGSLNHQVDPIVEAYRQKPYGPLGADSPAAHTQSASPLHQQNAAVVNETPVKATQVRVDLAVDGKAASSAAKSGNLHTGTLEPPKAGKVELVHLEEKKKKCCHCCVVQ